MQTALDILKIMIDDSSVSDDVLNVYLSLAGSKILNKMYPYGIPEDVTDVPECYKMTQAQIACFLYNKIGAEGEVIHAENGVSRQYGAADIPNDMIKEVVPKIGVIE